MRLVIYIMDGCGFNNKVHRECLLKKRKVTPHSHFIHFQVQVIFHTCTLSNKMEYCSSNGECGDDNEVNCLQKKFQKLVLIYRLAITAMDYKAILKN